MTRCLLVYFSQSGTTAQVAESIASGLRAEGYEVDLFNINGQQPPDIRGYNVLGFGSPVYYFRPPFSVTNYLKNLPELDGMPAFVFVMHGTYRFDTGNMIRRALATKGAKEVGYFHAHGHDLFVGYLKEGYLFSPNHPSDTELVEAEAFGHDIAAHVGDKHYIRPEEDLTPALIYRLGRFFTGHWFVNNFYTRLFRLDRDKCTVCGLCIKLCPMKNISEGNNRYPVWGRNCLLCFTCELTCPEKAITSPIREYLFRPFMIYNTRMAARDKSIDCERIDKSKWRAPAKGRFKRHMKPHS